MDAMDFKNNKDKAVVVFMFGLLMRLLTSLSFYSFFVMKNMYISFGSIDVIWNPIQLAKVLYIVHWIV